MHTSHHACLCHLLSLSLYSISFFPFLQSNLDSVWNIGTFGAHDAHYTLITHGRKVFATSRSTHTSSFVLCLFFPAMNFHIFFVHIHASFSSPNVKEFLAFARLIASEVSLIRDHFGIHGGLIPDGV